MTKWLLIMAAMLFAADVNAQDDYAAWAKKNDDGSWTRYSEKAVQASTLATMVPTDIAKFCPSYSSKGVDDRIKFWVGLISIIARPESNFKPETTYTESFTDGQGKKVVSRGLLQLSIESANQKKYSCGIAKAEDLRDPATNLSCGVRILEAWVKTDNVIATYGASAPLGGGRYWSTLREKKGYLPELVKFTRGLKICGEI